MSGKGKYYSGRYAVCSSCSARPCVCDELVDAGAGDQAAANVRTLSRPVSGNAIPFVVWDDLIGRYRLSIVESGVLLFLCRKTVGYGQHAGALISLRQIAEGLNIGQRSAQRALNVLQRHGLVERNRRYEPNSREHGATHIRVTLPA